MVSKRSYKGQQMPHRRQPHFTESAVKQHAVFGFVQKSPTFMSYDEELVRNDSFRGPHNSTFFTIGSGKPPCTPKTPGKRKE